MERTLVPTALAGAFKASTEKVMMADRLLVTLRQGVDTAQVDAFIKEHAGLRIEPVVTEWRMYRVFLPSTSDANFQAGFVALTTAWNLFQIVEPSYVYLISGAPNYTPSSAGIGYAPLSYSPASYSNDPLAGNQWDLSIVSAPLAWSVINSPKLPNGTRMVVGVLDTGITPSHPDLAANLWNNSSASHSVVSSGSISYYDGTYGANFFLPQEPIDDDTTAASAFSHGTHVSGIVGAAGNNNTGVTGTDWSVQLMAVKIFDSLGQTSDDIIITGINYAANHNAKVLNMSFTGPTYNQQTRDAIHNAGTSQGVICACASGNSSPGHQAAYNTDSEPLYPASYVEDNIVSVQSTTRNDGLAFYSSYGATTVHVAAPGGNADGTDANGILSTRNDGQYFYDNGTSMASPRVAGTLALMKGRFPNDSPRQLRDRLINSVDQLPSLNGKSVSGGRLDMLTAVSNWSKYSQSSGGWHYVPWFDWVNDSTASGAAGYPWTNHTTLGFMYVSPSSGGGTDNLYLYIDYFKKWFYTNDSLGDSGGTYMYRFADSSWLYYQKGSNNPKWFYNFRTGHWEGL